MTPHQDEREEPKPTEKDFAVAARVLARRPDSPPAGTDEYRRLLSAFAVLRATMRPQRFALLFGLREPRSGFERLTLRLHREEVPLEVAARELESFATRPIDASMVREFMDGCESRLDALQKFLALVAKGAGDRSADGRAELERSVERARRRMVASSPMLREEVRTVESMLNQLQSERGTVVRCGGFEAENASVLALRVARAASRAWKECVRAAQRDCTETACGLFHDRHVRTSQLPSVPELVALVRLERASLEARVAASAGPGSAAGASSGTDAVRDPTSVPDEDARARNSWPEVAARAERWVKEHGGKYPGRNKLARELGCSLGVLSKAVPSSAYLRARAAEKRQSRKRREVALPDDLSAPGPSAADMASNDEEIRRLVAEGQSEEEREERQRRAAARRPRRS